MESADRTLTFKWLTLKQLAVAVASTVVAWVGAWQTVSATGAGGGVTPDEVRTILNNESPYLKDRLFIKSSLTLQQNALIGLRNQVGQLQISNAEQVTKLNILLNRSRP